ncbi:MAG: SIS domain-containing protein [Chloroflexota bacterium]
MATTFDPTAPLPAPPDPWASSTMPSPRDGPPYHMTDMIAAEPHLARRLLARLRGDGAAAALADSIAAAVAAHEPIVVTGCGTSEHAAQGVALILRDALRTAGKDPGSTGILAPQAFEAALDPQRGGLLIAVSHEGGSAATNAAAAAARSNGARTALITAGPGSPGGAAADTVITTGEMDQSWCHTIGYVAPLVTAIALAELIIGGSTDDDAVARVMAGGAADEAAAEAIADAFGGTRHLIVIGSGADRPAARELVLKVEEAAWVPSAMRDLETFLHGHLPATGEETAVVVLLTDRDHRAERLARTRQALAASTIVGSRVAAILGGDAAASLPDSLTPSGRIVVPEAPSLAAPVASLLGSATALQLLTERIARARGTNPDPIRRDEPRYREASAATE